MRASSLATLFRASDLALVTPVRTAATISSSQRDMVRASVNPARSLLLLQDHEDCPFNIARIVALDLGRAGLAYLSACETALTISTLLDEAAPALADSCYRLVYATSSAIMGSWSPLTYAMCLVLLLPPCASGPGNMDAHFSRNFWPSLSPLLTNPLRGQETCRRSS
jgi:hypothetical protein